MSRIITIAREFGSGGRELGRRLAGYMSVAYYDNEIITDIAEKSGLAEEYVNSIVENRIISYYPITIGQTFSGTINPQLDLNTKIYVEQSNIIKAMAAKSDCVIIGRCSDYILRDFRPINIFVCADMEAKMRRCRERAQEGEEYTDSELRNRIQTVDKNRAKYYKFFTGRRWGDIHDYDLCINTSDKPIEEIVKPVADLIASMFEFRT